ncbi:RAI1 like PD-XK nuclease-domain-containing protein [Pavlovales sp. CCMP2436]|nr:RAI1 like PD-XK nuclease-domain-containing protein [Pavlovales sp. CCMP2436]
MAGMLVAHRAVEFEQELAAGCCTYDEPREVACFSRAADRSVRYNDRSQLRTFVRPELNSDLNTGFEAFVDKAAGAPIDDIVDALADGKADTTAAHFVTYRNNLNKLLYTPYSPRDEWQIGVSRHGRTIHLHCIETEAHAERERSRSEQERRKQYWGYAFEAAATMSAAARSSARAVSRPSDPAASATDGAAVNSNAEFCSIAQTKLGGNRIIFAAEVDCEKTRGFGEKGGGPHAMRNYVELKTSKLLLSSDEAGRRTLERFKMSKWWLQSFLLGITSIVCGFRDEAGVLRKMQDFEVKQLPKFVHGAWKPAVMLNFGSAALGWLYERVISGPPTARYVLAYEPAQRRLALRIAPEGVLPSPRPPPAAAAAAPASAEEAAAAVAAARQRGKAAQAVAGGKRGRQETLPPKARPPARRIVDE